MTDADWIEWNGGPCPVEPETMVEVRRASGRTVEGYRARCFQSIDGMTDADWWTWNHIQKPSDIIAYRIAKEQTP